MSRCSRSRRDPQSGVVRTPIVLPIVNHDNSQHAANENLRLQISGTAGWSMPESWLTCGNDGQRSYHEWLGTKSNRRHADFQSAALPTELPSRLTGSQSPLEASLAM